MEQDRRNIVKHTSIGRAFADPASGLSSAQVLERKRAGLSNVHVNPTTKTVGEIIKSNVCTYFNLVFSILALCIILVGSYVNLTFMIVVVINTIIGIIQEIRSKRTLDKLSLLSTPKATVIRDGAESVVDTEELVQDDIVVFSAGNQIPADAKIVDGEAAVNESLITGESVEIVKRAGDSLLSGSFIVSGKCRARLERVGKDSFVSKLTIEAKKMKNKVQSEMMRSLDNLVKWIGIAIIPMGIILFINQTFILNYGIEKGVVHTVAALVGMIPEGLYLLTSVALVVSVMRLARQNTLVHEMGCIETLARVDVLCVDKTGTITEDRMEVHDFILADGTEIDRQTAESLLGDFVGSMDADNKTMEALKTRFGRDNSRTAQSVVHFSSQTKYSGVSFSEDENYVIGAPEFILRENYQSFEETVGGYAKQGYRVLLLAEYLAPLTGDALCGEVIPLAFLLLINKIRDNAPKTFSYFTQQGVKIKVISGDNPIAVSEIAKQAGICDAEIYVDASTLESEEAIAAAAETYTVFGRVTPEQKRQLICAMKASGHTVAMTGDGVNDVLALKDADCSIAMASGSDVACHVSQLVLMDSDFSSMPQVVAEGRRVINNIERAASLFLVKNIFSFVFALITIFAVMQYPITPSQLSLVSITTIGIPSFFLALEPNSNLVRGRFIANVLYRALPAGLTNIVLVAYITLMADTFSIPSHEMSTMSTIVMGVVGLTMVYRLCVPFNLFRRILWGGVAALLACAVLFAKELFTLSELSFRSVLILVLFMLLAQPVTKFFYQQLNNIEWLLNKWKKKKT